MKNLNNRAKLLIAFALIVVIAVAAMIVSNLNQKNEGPALPSPLGVSVSLRMNDAPSDKENDIQPLEMAEAIFPDTGVALIYGEVVTCDRQEENSADYCLKMRLSNHDGTAPMTIDVIVSDNDYVTIGNGPVTGDLLISRCSDSEAVVDFSLTVGQQHVLKDIVAVQKSGGHFAANASSKDYNLELQILPIRKAI